LSNINPTWLEPRSNPGLHSGTPTTNRLSYDVAFLEFYLLSSSGEWCLFIWVWQKDRIYVTDNKRESCRTQLHRHTAPEVENRSCSRKVVFVYFRILNSWPSSKFSNTEFNTPLSKSFRISLIFSY
jgi:hypothetical protein